MIIACCRYARKFHRPCSEPTLCAVSGTDPCEFGPGGAACTVGGYCFPAASEVTVLRNGAPSNATISELALGDMVMVRHLRWPNPVELLNTLSSAPTSGRL